MSLVLDEEKINGRMLLVPASFFLQDHDGPTVGKFEAPLLLLC